MTRESRMRFAKVSRILVVSGHGGCSYITNIVMLMTYLHCDDYDGGHTACKLVRITVFINGT